MATDARSHTVPASGDAPARSAFLNLSKSIRDIVYTASAAAKATLISGLASAGLTVNSTNPLYTHRGDATAGLNLEYTMDAGVTVYAFDARPPTAWQAVTAATGYTSSAEVRLVYIGGTSFIQTRGSVSKNSGNLSRAVDICTLPSGYRPTATKRLVAALGTGSANANTTSILLSTGGVVQATGDNTTLGAATVLYLDGLWFEL